MATGPVGTSCNDTIKLADFKTPFQPFGTKMWELYPINTDKVFFTIDATFFISFVFVYMLIMFLVF